MEQAIGGKSRRVEHMYAAQVEALRATIRIIDHVSLYLFLYNTDTWIGANL